MVVLTPGGAGIGDPRARRREDVASDMQDELVSQTAAKELYGWAPGEAAE
jgi:N-methylhydantoinase B